MSLVAKAGDHGHILGDSITVQQWDQVAGGFRDQMRAGIAGVVRPPATNVYPATSVAGAVRASSASSTTLATPAAGYSVGLYLYLTSFGGNSYTIEAINANYNLFVTPFLPIDWVVLECVVNNQFTNPTTHLIDYSAFLDRLRSDGVKQVLCLGGLFFQFTGEQWTAGTPNTFNSGLSATHPIEANVVAACAARPSWTEYGSQWDWALALEAASNTPAPGAASGVYSLDGVHPNPACQVQMGTHAASHFTFAG